jgi:SNF2 family DNA or RNA helicase
MLTPRPYQLVGRDFLAARRFALLADEMRVGKTPQAILAAAKTGARSMLVACPAIAVPGWREELWKWWPGGVPPIVKVVSFDRLRLDKAVILSRRYDIGIVDECHFARNPETQRTKLIYGKGGMGWHCDRMWALSGTPAVKHAGELWAMLTAFGIVKIDYQTFVSHYCTVSWDGRITGTQENKILEVKALLADIMLRRTRKEVRPDMPEIDFQFFPVETNGADITMPSGFDDEAAADYVRDFGDHFGSDRVEVALSKVPALSVEIEQCLARGDYKQTVVFGWHKEPLTLLCSTLEANGIGAELITGATSSARRVQIQDNFKKGLTQVVVCNILAAGTAIDLSAASHGYFIELDWLPASNNQAASRLVSLQKGESVTIDVVTVPGTMDDRIQRVLVKRAKSLSQLI